ncbi:hypothetical protein BDV97DRAFT_425007 [Delphinella strobiligena]|nr:hypothetical protein BDV97DRAFT_425007 [Delphinella strobiligena]
MLLKIKCSLLLLSASLAQVTQAHSGTEFHNKNSQPMHISNDWTDADVANHPGIVWENMTVAPGEMVFLSAPDDATGKYYIGPTDNSRTAEVGENRDSNTIVESFYGGYAGFTYFDVDIEKGFSVPIWCHGAQEEWGTGQGCLEDVLAACPDRDRHIDETTGIYDFCRGDNENAESVAIRTALCPNVYVLAEDNRTRTINPGHVVKCIIYDPPPPANLERRSMERSERRTQRAVTDDSVEAHESDYDVWRRT